MSKPKRFNKSYNYDYNRELPITYSEHSYSRLIKWNADVALVERTIRTGRINYRESQGKKRCLERYYGKLNVTYIVVAVFHKKHIEVKTIWIRTGR